MLLIEGVTMPTEDVSDLRDVVDAINRLCETMRNSDEPEYEDCSDVIVHEEDLVSPAAVTVSQAQVYTAETWSDPVDGLTSECNAYVAESWSDADVPPASDQETVVPSDIESQMWAEIVVQTASKETTVAEVEPQERWSDVIVQDDAKVEGTTVTSDVEVQERWSDVIVPDVAKVEETTVRHVEPRGSWRDVPEEVAVSKAVVVEAGPCIDRRSSVVSEREAPPSEMYYTASSEVSLLSDTDLPDKGPEDDRDKDDRNIMAGHVAAMRERFESMTRANTPCPDLVRSLSPSLDVFRNVTPSPDFLDKS